MIDAVLAHQDDAIHGKFLASEGEGSGDRAEDWNVLRFADLLAQAAFLKLVDVSGHDFHA